MGMAYPAKQKGTFSSASSSSRNSENLILFKDGKIFLSIFNAREWDGLGSLLRLGVYDET